MFQSKPIVTAVPYHEIYDNTGTGLQGSGESTSWKSNLVQNMKVILHTPHTMQWCGLATGEAGRKGIGKSSVTIMIVLLSKAVTWFANFEMKQLFIMCSGQVVRIVRIISSEPFSRWQMVHLHAVISMMRMFWDQRLQRVHIWDVHVGNAKSSRIYCFWMSLLKANANNCDLL